MLSCGRKVILRRMPSDTFCTALLKLLFLGGMGLELRGTQTLSHIPSPILYFIQRQGLTELLSASLLLRLVLTQDPPASASGTVGIIVVHHRAQLELVLKDH